MNAFFRNELLFTQDESGNFEFYFKYSTYSQLDCKTDARCSWLINIYRIKNTSYILETKRTTSISYVFQCAPLISL